MTTLASPPQPAPGAGPAPSRPAAEAAPERAAMPPPEVLGALIAGGLGPEAAAALLPGMTVKRLTVERVHFPGGKPVQLQIRALGASGESRGLIAEWLGAEAEAAARSEAARLAKLRRGQGAQPGEVAIVAAPASGLVLRQPGFDARLPGLRLLHDPAWAREALAGLGLDPAASVRLVAHRLGKRAVLRIDGPQGTHYARLRPVTSASGQDAYDRHGALWSALQGQGGLSIPGPAGFEAAHGLALFAALPGMPPVFEGVPGFRACHTVTSALRTLQSLPLDAPAHGSADEVAILQTWADRTLAVFPALAAPVQSALSKVQDDLARLPPLPAVPCHRDLHEGQILLAPGHVGLLDFDTLRLADPALDLGNLQAHLVLAGLRDGRSRGAFLTALDNGLPDLPPKRTLVWRRAALLRLAMIYAFSSENPAVIHGLLREAV